MFRNFIQKNVTVVSIILFVIIFSIIQFTKPAFLYKKDGSIREFGVGYTNKTILPIWLLSIILGILSYGIVTYSIVNTKFF
jgi:ABC-type multidrug transport system permease subunit